MTNPAAMPANTPTANTNSAANKGKPGSRAGHLDRPTTSHKKTITTARTIGPSRQNANVATKAHNIDSNAAIDLA